MAGTDDLKAAGSIILKDLALFNRAVVFFQVKIAPVIRTEIEHVVSEWAKGKGWMDQSDVSEGLCHLWVSPPQWAASKEDRRAWFAFGDSGDANDSLDIADLFGAGQTHWGFRFEVDHGTFGGKTAWYTYAKGLGELGQRLGERGWVNEGKGIFFRSVLLPADLMAAAWESEAWENALAPLEQALEALAADVPIFDAIVNGAKLTEA